VAKAAAEDDRNAQAILQRGGEELANLALALIARAGNRPVGFTGGVLGLHPLIVDTIRQQLAGIEVRLPDGEAALAAARLQTSSDASWRETLARRSSIS
jgi:N-acetylglucosamine kinase-like BadF-type ATPase